MYDVIEHNHERGRLTTTNGFIEFEIKGLPGNCGITLISNVYFFPKDSSNKVTLALLDEFNDFLTQSYKDADGYEEHDWNPFAYTLNRAMLMVTDAEWGENNNESDASLWKMCTESKKWKRGRSTINPNTNNKIAIFTHVRHKNNVSET